MTLAELVPSIGAGVGAFLGQLAVYPLFRKHLRSIYRRLGRLEVDAGLSQEAEPSFSVLDALRAEEVTKP